MVAYVCVHVCIYIYVCMYVYSIDWLYNLYVSLWHFNDISRSPFEWREHWAMNWRQLLAAAQPQHLKDPHLGYNGNRIASVNLYVRVPLASDKHQSERYEDHFRCQLKHLDKSRKVSRELWGKSPCNPCHVMGRTRHNPIQPMSLFSGKTNELSASLPTNRLGPISFDKRY